MYIVSESAWSIYLPLPTRSHQTLSTWSLMSSLISQHPDYFGTGPNPPAGHPARSQRRWLVPAQVTGSSQRPRRLMKWSRPSSLNRLGERRCCPWPRWLLQHLSPSWDSGLELTPLKGQARSTDPVARSPMGSQHEIHSPSQVLLMSTGESTSLSDSFKNTASTRHRTQRLAHDDKLHHKFGWSTTKRWSLEASIGYSLPIKMTKPCWWFTHHNSPTFTREMDRLWDTAELGSPHPTQTQASNDSMRGGWKRLDTILKSFKPMNNQICPQFSTSALHGLAQPYFKSICSQKAIKLLLPAKEPTSLRKS